MFSSRKHRPEEAVRQSGDWLDALTVMGRILIFIPFFLGVLAVLYRLASGENIDETLGLDFVGSAAAVGLIFLCGVTTLAYVAIKRFQKAASGKTEPDDHQGNMENSRQ